MKDGFIEIDLDKIKTIEEVVAVLKLSFRCHNWDGESSINISTNVVNQTPILNNLIRDS